MQTSPAESRRRRAQAAAEDQARHRDSLRRWLAANGYGGPYFPVDVRKMLAEAGLEPEEVTMQTTTEQPAARATHNGHAGARRAAPGPPIMLTPVDAPPPSRSTATGRWLALLPQLQAEPGHWFDAGVHAHGASETLRRKGVEVAKRSAGEAGRSRVYLRWPAG